MLCVYVFQKDNKYYLFDYKNILIFIIDYETYRKIRECLLDETKTKELKTILSEYIQAGLFLENDRNKFIEMDSTIAYLSIPTVHRCNMKCKYCFADGGKKYRGEKKEISHDVINRALDFLENEYKTVDRYRIDFVSGGEPLLNFETIQYTYNLIKKKSDKNVMIWLATNGTLLNNENVTYLDKHNIQFGISLDGVKEDHDKNRIDQFGNGTYDKIINNIKKLKENKKLTRNTRDIWILTTVTSETKSLVKIIREYEELGIDRIQTKIVRIDRNNNLGLNEDSVDYFIKLYRELVDYLVEEMRKYRFDAIEMIMNRNDILGKVLLSLLLREPSITRCMAGRGKISITAQGDIYPCESFLGIEHFCLGNVYSGINKNNPFIDLNVYTQKGCQICWARYICGGGCYYRNYVESGSITQGSDAYCTFYKKLIELAIELVDFINSDDIVRNELIRVASGKIKMEW